MSVSRSVLTQLDPMNVIVYLTLHCILMDLAAFLVKLWSMKLTYKILLYSVVFVGPPFTLSLVNNSPRVKGSTVSIDFAASTPIQSATCFLGKEFMKDCELFMEILMSVLIVTFFSGNPTRYKWKCYIH